MIVSYKVFCGWPFTIQDLNGATLKRSFIRNDLKVPGRTWSACTHDVISSYIVFFHQILCKKKFIPTQAVTSETLLSTTQYYSKQSSAFNKTKYLK